MTEGTSFVLAGPSGTFVARGIKHGFDEITTAATALRDGDVDLVVGALPFDIRGRAALLQPHGVSHTLASRPTTPLPAVRIVDAVPGTQVHRDRIITALRRLRDDANPLQKVVLARALRLAADGPMNPWEIMYRLIEADPQATAYLTDLSPAGPQFAGTALVGASPELLVARAGSGELSAVRRIGGAIRRPRYRRGQWCRPGRLGQDRHEHRLVVETMRAALQPLCSQLDIASEPQLSRTGALWHLCTPIVGTLRDGSTTALDLALALHPTPAVGGVPTADAVDLIAELEGDRGFYAGAVGWCDSRGDGRWVSGHPWRAAFGGPPLRGGAGDGGIVAESDADDEVAETTTKFSTILSALGIRG